jgi:hypothetical protein
MDVGYDVDIPSLKSDFYKTLLFNSMPTLHLLILVRLQPATDGPSFFVFQATGVESVTDCEPHLRAPRL